MTTVQQNNNQNILSLPFGILAMVFPFNLPNINGNNILQLNPLSIYRIFTGNLTHWNDPLLISLNPTLSLPNEIITIVLKTTVGAGTLYNTIFRAFSKIDKNFVLPPISSAGLIDFSDYKFKSFIDAPASITGVASVVVNTPYSIGISFQFGASVIGAPVAGIVNEAGQTVFATPQSLSTASIENGLSPMRTSIYAGVDYDLTMPTSQYAYPFATYYYLLLSVKYIRSTCATGSQLLQFLIQLYTDSVINNIGQTDDIIVIPQTVQSALNIINILSTQVSCEGAPLILSTQSNIKIQGTGINGFGFALLVSFYAGIDTEYTYTFTHEDVPRSILQLQDGEIDIVVLNSANVKPRLTPASNTLVLPMWATAVAPYINIPNLNQQLVLSMDVIAKIFLGRILSWNDPAILNDNLALKPFLLNMTSSEIVVVVCCSFKSDLLKSGNMFVDSINASLSRIGSPLAFESTVLTSPVNWAPLFNSRFVNTSNFILVPTEARLQATVDNNRNAIGYVYITSSNPSPLSYPSIKLNDPTTNSVYTVVPSLSSISSCGLYSFPNTDNIVTPGDLASAQMNAINEANNMYNDIQALDEALISLSDSSSMTGYYSQQCFPFTNVISLVLLNNYQNKDSALCKQANHSLSFAQWLIQNDQLATTTQINGIIRLSSMPQYHTLLLNALNSVWCGTQDTILIRQPVYWSLSSGVSGFGVAFASLGILVVVVSQCVLYYFHTRPVFKSASPSMLFMILVGLLCLFASIISYVSPISTASCATWFWLLNLGFILTFSPLFIKTWRIYQIFNRKVLKVVKIKDHTLILTLFAHVSIELLLLIIAQSSTPLTVINFKINDGVRDHIYPTCATEKSGLTIISILSIEKGMLLLFGAIMGFSIRRVDSTFNESSQVAWAIYNVTFSVIIIPILVLTGANGDTLVIMVVLISLWISYCTYGLMFGIKFFQVSVTEDEVFTINKSGTSDGSGFSFISIIALSDEQLVRYHKALEKHFNTVLKRLAHIKNQTKSVVDNHNPANTNKGGLITSAGIPSLLQSGPSFINKVGPASQNNNHDNHSSIIHKNNNELKYKPDEVSLVGKDNKNSGNNSPIIPARDKGPLLTNHNNNSEGNITPNNVTRNDSQRRANTPTIHYVKPATTNTSPANEMVHERDMLPSAHNKVFQSPHSFKH